MPFLGPQTRSGVNSVRLRLIPIHEHGGVTAGHRAAHYSLLVASARVARASETQLHGQEPAA
jgi:hypothetical protein